VRFHLRPLGIRQNKPIHAKLLSELESPPGKNRNPESQQALDPMSLSRIGVARL
jgi:hypothetical protein